MGDTGYFFEQGKAHAEKAVDYDRAACKSSDPDKYNNARNSYLRAIDYYHTALRREKSKNIKSSLRNTINSYMDRKQVMEEWLDTYCESQSKESKGPSEKSSTAEG